MASRRYRRHCLLSPPPRLPTPTIMSHPPVQALAGRVSPTTPAADASSVDMHVMHRSLSASPVCPRATWCFQRSRHSAEALVAIA